LNEAIDHVREALKIQRGYAGAQRNLERALRGRDEVKREGR
jgi:hypothetical protein